MRKNDSGSKYGLDKSMRSIQKVVGEKGRMAGFSPKDRKNPLSVLGWIILAIIVLTFSAAFCTSSFKQVLPQKTPRQIVF